MKYLVIGEPCIDLIHKVDGGVINSYGGILYSVLSLSVLTKGDDTVFPLMNLGEDEYDNVTDILKEYPNVNIDGVNRVSHPTRKVNLYYNQYKSGMSARFEQSSEPTYTLDYSIIEKFLSDADALLINMISGVDITLETLKKIRDNFNGVIHIDLHNLVMKTNADGTREHASVDNWIEWCIKTDTIQMNEFEISSLSAKKMKEYELAEKMLTHPKTKVQGVIVTRGINGSSGYVIMEKKFGEEKFLDLNKHDISAVENPHFIDSTGCGDVFAASFLLDFSKNKDFLKSLHYANRIASFNTSLEGINELYNLR
jgi:sugar/nucleoside kinase (ribokinase family)